MSARSNARAAGRLTGDPSLLQAMIVFSRYTSPRAWIALSLVAVGARLWIGAWSLWDFVLIAVMLVLQSFVEWAIHVFILHFKPRRVFGRTFDLHAARLHRAHHRAPWQLGLIFVPKLTGLVGVVLACATWALLLPTTPLVATGIAYTLVSLLVYEWIHFLTHTNYRPRTAFYRRRWRLHRLHHFKNEHYWQGVTAHLADRVLGTMADPADVETSKTCRTLGVTR